MSARNTFGLKDPKTRKPYKDILKAFLSNGFLTNEDLRIGYLSKNGLDWHILTDMKVIEVLQHLNYCPVLVSFQHRTTGLFAICRIQENEGNKE